jgi:aryl-alcohol dehydrogenase-like predicted oxidoreductase
VKRVAAEVGCTPVQLALAWLLAKGGDAKGGDINGGDINGGDIVPIPGTKRVTYLEENVAAADITLTHEQVRVLDESLPAAAGDRYDEGGMRSVNH